MLGTIWLIIKVLLGSIAIVALSGILILLVQGFLDQIFKDKTHKNN